MNDEVLEFIERRWRANDSNWLNGNCYWFAWILKSRFPKLEIFYLPVTGHFVAGDTEKKTYYDWSGKVEIKESFYSLNLLFQEDPLLYNRLMRDCRN